MAKETKQTTGDDLEAFERAMMKKAKTPHPKPRREPPKPSAPVIPAKPETEEERAFRVLKLANESKPLPSSELEFLRELLKRGGAQALQGGIAHQALVTAIDRSHTTTLTKEIYRLDIESMRRNLGYEASPEIERLLIDQVCMCAFRLWMTEHRHSRELDRDGLSFQQAEYNERVLTASHRRYDTAIETLARVRKLKLAPVQVNIAQAGAKQTNIATGAAQVQPKPLPSAEVLEGVSSAKVAERVTQPDT